MNANNNSRRSRKVRRLDSEDIDTVVDIRSRRRCHYQRSGMDPISLAVHVWAETGHVPDWDDGYDGGDDGWAA